MLCEMHFRLDFNTTIRFFKSASYHTSPEAKIAWDFMQATTEERITPALSLVM